MRGSTQIKKTEVQLRELIHGLERHVPAAKRFHLDGRELTRDEFLAHLASKLALYTRVRELATLHAHAIDQRDKEHAGARELLAYARDLVHSFVGRDRVKLTDFGMRPRKPPRKLTAEENVRKAERIRATRKARGI